MGVGSNWTPCFRSTRTAVSASRESRLRRSPLHGETRRRSALSVASTAQLGRARSSMSPARPNAVHEMLSRPLRLLAETRHHNSGFRASAVRSVAGGSSDPDGRWRRPDASTTHTGSTVPRFYSSDDPPWCRVRATHRETVIPSDLLFASQRQACAEKPPPITNLYGGSPLSLRRMAAVS